MASRVLRMPTRQPALRGLRSWPGTRLHLCKVTATPSVIDSMTDMLGTSRVYYPTSDESQQQRREAGGGD